MTNDSNLDRIIQSSQVIIRKGRYAYLKASEICVDDSFMVVQDGDEITIVTEEKDISKTKYDASVKWFKLFEILVSVPFYAKGFLARITDAISSQGLNVLVISTFSKDFVLVREESYEVAEKALKDIGFPISKES